MFGIGVGAKRACGEGAVDSQHGTGVEGSLLPCTKATCSLHSRRGLVQEDKRTVFAYTHGLFIT